MEKILKQHDKERMKRAILEQEETFRQQVHELHRLYRVQKQLMKEMKMNRLKKDQWNPTPRLILDLELPAEDYIQYSDEREIELTLAVGSSRRKQREDQKSNTSDSAGSFSSSSVESGSLKLLGHDWGMSKVTEMYLASHREMNNGFDDENEMRRDRVQKQQWLLPCLSLTMS
ncbi:uncharacterized protein LOC110038412 isoform X1 [Phalaenopsis equestris]|uniref:uncharacterized protein LOC110038412 isoform X1 n=1 Tax=Phalaenopsis equestris TaxID=78828 RepID=UPI0009E38A94|nr:uncharacterized protein LOC110038412 isoform X1 [Phalaenopsis equestris]